MDRMLERSFLHATVAQLVEQCFRKAEVPGSIPGGGSRMFFTFVKTDV